MEFSRKFFSTKDFDEASQVYSSLNMSQKHPLLCSGGDVTFVENLWEKWRTGKFCDVKLYPGKPKHKESHGEPAADAPFVLAHKMVIDYASPYFGHVFRVCDKEDKLEAVLIPALDMFTLEFLVNYIYTGTVEGMTMTNMETLLNGAETLRLEPLKEASGVVLAELMSHDEAMDKWTFAIGHSLHDSYYIYVLQTYATDFIFDNHLQMFESERFLGLNEQQIERLLMMGTARERAPAAVILLAATSWVKFDCDSRQDLLPQLLERIPLEEVPMPYLKTCFREDPLISANMKCQQYYLEFLEKLAMSNDRTFTAKHKLTTSNQTDDHFRSGLGSSLSLIQSVKSSHRPREFLTSKISSTSTVSKQEITKLKFKGDQEFRTFSACITPTNEHQIRSRERLSKKDSETSTRVEFTRGIQTEVDCLKMSNRIASCSVQCGFAETDKKNENYTGTKLSNSPSEEGPCSLENKSPKTKIPNKNSPLPPKESDGPLPRYMTSIKASESKVRSSTAAANVKPIISSCNSEPTRQKKSTGQNLGEQSSLSCINKCGDDSKGSNQKCSEEVLPPPKNVLRPQSNDPFSSRIARPICFDPNESVRSCNVSSYELNSPPSSKLCKAEVSTSNHVYGSIPWKPAFPRVNGGMMDEFPKHRRAASTAFGKRGRPGRRKSKLHVGRNCMNSKLSLPTGHSLKCMLDSEIEHPRAGTPNRIMSRMTANFRNNRLMFYVEDTVKEERYLMSYDFSSKFRSKLAAYSFAGTENCFVFYKGSLYDFGGKFRDQADCRVAIFDFDQEGKKPRWRARAVPSMALPRYGFQCAILNDYVYVIGGFHTLGAMNLCERLYVGGGLKSKLATWEHVATLNRTRAHSAAVVFRGKIYAVGGFSADSEERSLKIAPTNSVEYYDPKVNEWCWCPGMQSERSGLCAVVLHNRMYAFGGGLCRFSEYSDSKLKSVEVYDEEKFEWKYCASMKRARQNFSAVVFENRIYAIGGDDEKDPTVESYDPIENSWMILEHLPASGNYQTIGFKDSVQTFTESIQSL